MRGPHKSILQYSKYTPQCFQTFLTASVGFSMYQKRKESMYYHTRGKAGHNYTRIEHSRKLAWVAENRRYFLSRIQIAIIVIVFVRHIRVGASLEMRGYLLQRLSFRFRQQKPVVEHPRQAYAGKHPERAFRGDCELELKSALLVCSRLICCRSYAGQ